MSENLRGGWLTLYIQTTETNWCPLISYDITKMLKCLSVGSPYPTTTTVTVWRWTNQELVYSETWRTASRATPTPSLLCISSGTSLNRVSITSGYRPVYRFIDNTPTVNLLTSRRVQYTRRVPHLTASCHDVTRSKHLTRPSACSRRTAALTYTWRQQL